MLFASGFIQALAKFAVLQFHLGEAADQAMVLPLKGLLFLRQYGQASAHVQKFPITFLAAETWDATRCHGDLHKLGSAREGRSSRCIPIVRAGSSSRNRLKKGCFPGGEKT
jgi:hypothetical protein